MFWCLNLLSEWKQWKVKARQISQWNQRIVPNTELCTWTTVSWLTNSRVIYKKWSDIFLSFRWLNNMLLKSSDIPFFPLSSFFSIASSHPGSLVPSILPQSLLPPHIPLCLFFTLFFPCLFLWSTSFPLPSSFPCSLFYPPSFSICNQALSVTVGLFVYQLQEWVFAKNEITVDETMWRSSFPLTLSSSTLLCLFSLL